MMKTILFSIIAKDQREMDASFEKVKGHVRSFQLDVMDGEFVENTSLDFDFRLPKCDCIFEAHLMVKEPMEWIAKMPEQVRYIIFHAEATHNPYEVIQRIKDKGKKVGIALNPETPASHIRDLTSEIDMVLVMTVHPGKYGARFLPEMLEKVKELRKENPKLEIEVDGGITPETIGMASEAGANRFISGSYIKNSEDVRKTVNELQRIAGGQNNQNNQ